MVLARTPLGRIVEIPPGWAVVPILERRVTLIKRSDRGNLLIGLEVGRDPAHSIARPGPSRESVMRNARLPSPTEDVPIAPVSLGVRRPSIVPPQNVRVLVLPGAAVDELHARWGGHPIVSSTVIPAAAYSIWTAIMRVVPGPAPGMAGTVGYASSYSPARVPTSPQPHGRRAPAAPVTYKTVSALLFGSFGIPGVYSRSTFRDVMRENGWRALGETIAGQTDAEFVPPPRPTPAEYVPRWSLGARLM